MTTRQAHIVYYPLVALLAHEATQIVSLKWNEQVNQATTVGRDEQGGLSRRRWPMDCAIIPTYGEVCRCGCVQTVVHGCVLSKC